MPCGVICCKFFAGSTKEETANANKELSASRAKRASNNDYMRYGRALYMLRLGKRDYDSPLYLENEDDDSVYGRFRRSLSSTDEAALSNPQFQTKDALSQNLVGDLEEAKENKLPWNLPHEAVYNVVLPRAIFQTLDDETSSDEDLDDVTLGKRQLQMLRLGKRSLHMLRLGKRENDNEEEKRSLQMLRLGKREDEEDKRSLKMLRLGKRQQMGRMRMGTSFGWGKNLQDEYKNDGYLYENAKRALNMLRLGKRQLAMLRLGKRGLAMLRLGKRSSDDLENYSEINTEKRPISMLRLGKREEEEKRSLKMLRLG